MTEALFLEAAECEEQLKEQGKRRLNVSGVLKILGVSRSGYLNWKKRLPSQRELRKRAIKKRILEIYHDSHQNLSLIHISLVGWCRNIRHMWRLL